MLGLSRYSAPGLVLALHLGLPELAEDGEPALVHLGQIGLGLFAVHVFAAEEIGGQRRLPFGVLHKLRDPLVPPRNHSWIELGRASDAEDLAPYNVDALLLRGRDVLELRFRPTRLVQDGERLALFGLDKRQRLVDR